MALAMIVLVYCTGWLCGISQRGTSTIIPSRKYFHREEGPRCRQTLELTTKTWPAFSTSSSHPPQSREAVDVVVVRKLVDVGPKVMTGSVR